MLYILLILFASVVLYYTLKGELQYVRDNLEIQLRQARFRLDRLERRVRELEEDSVPQGPRASEDSEAPATQAATPGEGST